MFASSPFFSSANRREAVTMKPTRAHRIVAYIEHFQLNDPRTDLGVEAHMRRCSPAHVAVLRDAYRTNINLVVCLVCLLSVFGDGVKSRRALLSRPAARASECSCTPVSQSPDSFRQPWKWCVRSGDLSQCGLLKDFFSRRPRQAAV
ncbi:hypothetical protein VUR80DRAFT_5309 [Thermomyces stellatus]